MRNLIGMELGVALFALGALSCGETGLRPHRLILIVIDTLRSDHVSCYGTASATPAIDAIAARGQRFTRATSSFHQTSMSMGAMFTGRTPSIATGELRKTLSWTGQTWCGLARFGKRNDDLCVPTSLRTLAETLRDMGYWTLGIASNEIMYEPSGFSRGFAKWVELPSSAVPGRR